MTRLLKAFSLVLIVDDDPSVSRDISRHLDALARDDFLLIAQTDPTQALDAIRQHRPHLILLDYNMPKMNGLEVMEAICGLPHPPPVIFLSNFAEHRYAALALGAHDFFVKADVTMRALIQRISEITDNTREREILTEELFITDFEDLDEDD